MSKRKKESDDQPLFVRFANSKLERNDIFNILHGFLDKLPRKIKSRADISKINNYKPNDKNHFEDLKKYIESEFTPPQFTPPHNKKK